MFDSFFATLDRLGSTEVERARVLGITDRQLLNWRKGQIPRIMRCLAANPDLLDALRPTSNSSQPQQAPVSP